jgi:hypothetical protein
VNIECLPADAEVVYQRLTARAAVLLKKSQNGFRSGHLKFPRERFVNQFK